MRILLPRFFASDRAATAIEYAIIAGFIAVAIVAVVGSIGSTLNTTFSNVAAGF